MQEHPGWFDEDEGKLVILLVHFIHVIRSCHWHLEMYSILCYVEKDLSCIPRDVETSPVDHDDYYKINFDVIVDLALTEMKAYIAWKEDVRKIYKFVIQYFSHPPLRRHRAQRKGTHISNIRVVF